MFNKYEAFEKLAKKAKAEWGEDWSTSAMDYIEEYNEIVVWVGRMDVYKAFFDADTLECTGTKC